MHGVNSLRRDWGRAMSDDHTEWWLALEDAEGGDPVALVEYISRRQCPLEDFMKTELIELLRFLDISALRADRCGPSPARNHDRDIEIGAWIAARDNLTKRGTMARIRQAAANKFLVSEGTARRCYLAFKKGAQGNDASYLYSGAYWRAVKEFCDERQLDYFEIHTLSYLPRNELVKRLDLDF